MTKTLILGYTTSSSKATVTGAAISSCRPFWLYCWMTLQVTKTGLFVFLEKIQLCWFLKMWRHEAQMPKQDTWGQWQRNTQVHVNTSFVRELPLLADMKNLGFCEQSRLETTQWKECLVQQYPALYCVGWVGSRTMAELSLLLYNPIWNDLSPLIRSLHRGPSSVSSRWLAVFPCHL